MRTSRTATTLAAIVATALVVAACGGGSDDSNASADQPTTTSPADPPTTTSASSTTTEPAEAPLSEIVPMDATGAQAIEAPGFADWVSVAEGAAWVANVGGGVRRYDVATGAELGTTPVEGFICQSMDVGFDSLWLASCGPNTVVRIELATGNVLATIATSFEVADEASIAAGDDAVYVMSADPVPTVARIDPATNAVVGTFAAPQGAAAVRAGFGALWFSQPHPGSVTKVDLDDGSVIATADTGNGARFLTVSDDAVWVMANSDATVTRVDEDAHVVATIEVGTRAVIGGDIAAGGSFVWARVSDSVVAQIDPETNTVVARFGNPAGSGSVAADESNAWISAHDEGTVWRLPLG